MHDIKGEDRDAVMVVIDRPRSKRHGAQAELWGSALAGEEIDAKDAEEKRIAFVALTRAKRICVVALPTMMGAGPRLRRSWRAGSGSPGWLQDGRSGRR